MASGKVPYSLFLLYFILGIFYQCFAIGIEANQTTRLFVNASEGRLIPETLFEIFFEEINHAGAGGLWAELVSNRGFEAGGKNIPSTIDPWSLIGDESSLIVSTDRSSCFERNKIALRMEVLCDIQGCNICPVGGVGVYNPGFCGMAIKQGKMYKIVFYIHSLGSVNLSVSLTSSNGLQMLATTNIKASASDVSNWTKVETLLEAKETNHTARLQLTTSRKGLIWIDQVSAMPLDTYKGHDFRNDLVQMLADIKPGFIRFPGGCFVEDEWLRNAFRWKDAVGPWEERPGHFGDVWMYWTDDGLGYFEFLQLSEDLGALPIWVFNNGISHNDEVNTFCVQPSVQEALDGIEFARGDPNSTWGSVRAAMGHTEPFDLRYVAVGNEDCPKKNYRGNYLKFYQAIKLAHPDVEIISNCDGFVHRLDHPAGFYDVHIYSPMASQMFSMAHRLDRTSRDGPKAFVSEYAVVGKDAVTGNRKNYTSKLGGHGFRNDLVEMRADIEPRFIRFPGYWLRNAFRWKDTVGPWEERPGHFGDVWMYWTNYGLAEDLRALPIWVFCNGISLHEQVYTSNVLPFVQVVNFEGSAAKLKISVDGLQPNSINLSGSTTPLLTSNNLMDKNPMEDPNKVVPSSSRLENVDKKMEVVLSPHSFTSFDYDLKTSPLCNEKHPRQLYLRREKNKAGE